MGEEEVLWLDIIDWEVFEVVEEKLWSLKEGWEVVHQHDPDTGNWVDFWVPPEDATTGAKMRTTGRKPVGSRTSARIVGVTKEARYAHHTWILPTSPPDPWEVKFLGLCIQSLHSAYRTEPAQFICGSAEL